MIEPILVKTLLTTVLSAGMQATAATATIPAASAYSTRSCPCVSRQKFLQMFFTIVGSFPNSTLTPELQILNPLKHLGGKFLSPTYKLLMVKQGAKPRRIFLFRGTRVR